MPYFKDNTFENFRDVVIKFQNAQLQQMPYCLLSSYDMFFNIHIYK